MPDEQAFLFERLRKSDIAAFEELFRTYYEKLCLFANRFTNDLPEAEELVSDSFAQIWEKREQLLISISFRSYIYRAVKNRCLNYLKHRTIERRYIDYLQQTQRLFDDQTDGRREAALEREVEEAIQALPEKCREIFVLSRYRALKYAEIAALLNISLKTVERQMSIALEKLRCRLQDLAASA